jgi:ribosomal protein L29
MRRQLTSFRTQLSANQEETQNTMKSVQSDVQSVRQYFNETRCELTNQISSNSVAIEAVQTSIARVETVGQRLLRFITRFPADIRETLLKIMQLNYHTYTLLLNVQQKLTLNPSNTSNTDIKFIDALNRERRLPFDVFRFWEVRAHYWKHALRKDLTSCIV